ncbi:hypothetical protein [Pengzhenrongella sicca]|uniref:Uncharacterized protein n=1 Tax=Pengzhenrongella sicca TaxID=2819238 RepID=A0A8A4Z9J2_9MICO|nr:hypothetical protein [Pengzhenrongella sicca]QTE28580.1 hypothetical protein J4E96_14570 [Pengzhenrongella sicca]
MPHLLAALTVLKALLTNTYDDDPERGSVTIEHVLWAAAVIAIVGIVVAAINAYVTAQTALIT